MWRLYLFCLKNINKAPGLFHFVGSLLASIKYFLCPPDIRRIVRNIRLIRGRNYPIFKAFLLGHRVLVNFVHYWLDFIYLGRVAPHLLKESVEIEGRQYLDEALSLNKGVIIATAHFGNWEIAGFWLGENGYPIQAIALPHKDKKINEFFDSTRAMHNVRVIPTGRSTRCIGVLKEKGALAILGDWDFSGGKAVLDVDFFGRRVLFPSGVGVFAHRFKVPVVPLFGMIEAPGRYRLKAFPPISPEGKSASDILQAYVKALENVLRERPLQWYMFGEIRYAPEGINKNELCIVIPAYNEEKHIGSLLNKLAPTGYKVILVDDGSVDKTSEVASQYEFVILHRLSCNEGKGVAIKEGLAIAKKEGFKWAVLMDADGQHLPEDIPSFLSKAFSDVGMVCGNRMHNPEGMPLLRRLVNRIMSVIISLYTFDSIPDTQCGYRLIRLSAIDPDKLTSDRYEIETDIILRVREEGWEIVSTNITSVYHDTAVSYINPFRDTLRFIYFMCMDFLRRIARMLSGRRRDERDVGR